MPQTFMNTEPLLTLMNKGVILRKRLCAHFLNVSAGEWFSSGEAL